MTKDSRLSFRISPELNKRIDLMVELSSGVIRDRSELGTRAIKFFLNYLRDTADEQKVIVHALVALAKHTETESPEIQKFAKQYKIDEPPLVESHAKYEEILYLKEKFIPEIQTEIIDKLNDATYNEIDVIYEYYQQKYHLEGIEHKAQLKELAVEPQNK
ncbi:MAG: hypothetical protein ACXAD7_00570 [Candidatus Kariarchaeaceae archaeon]|jgi:hypothetical protein